ncbi:sulfur carrier protein ThiS [Formosa algae]|uniref:Sulfur carrier protein n=1 Tax=Formosa algae TaxID=225843 RepID=A0A9X0YPW5_9FLAO|nr:sulfur carrier protein ThiS [Formosa algae]MBP1841197.1 sulfur carrier protein [Formosa algae]MDQ0336383.1 sulfur carrier protein [Formosa algae]OEI81349.1 thiamine biosynthesis protein ThiS [Formosa algae]PNW27893.1 thiamine biosynthesis protein ThiS [Formosa algae]
MISINVNNAIHQVAEHSVLATIISKLSPIQNGIAVAVNNTVIPKSNWDNVKVSNNDNILIIQATQGG